MLAALEGPIESHLARVIDPIQAKYNLNFNAQQIYTKVITYHNGTMHDITVVDRSGVAICVQRQKAVYEKVFVVVVTWELHPMTLHLFLDNMLRANRYSNSETDLFVQRASYIRTKSSTLARVDIHYAIDEAKLIAAKDHTLYIDNLDIVVSLANVDRVPRHPYSQSTLLPAKECQSTMNVDSGDSYYRVEIIDNKNYFGDRFINNNGTIQKITAKKDITRHCGVYLYHCDEKITEESSCYIHRKYFDFDVADKELSLFKSRIDAQTLGDMTYRQKMELAQAQEKAQKFKIELDEKEREYSSEKLAYEHRKYQRDILAAEHRNTHELQQGRTKAVTEYLKTIGSISAGILAVFTVMQKLQLSKS